jgi:hypothetical protein
MVIGASALLLSHEGTKKKESHEGAIFFVPFFHFLRAFV